MKFGVFAPPFRVLADPRRLVELASLAESTGWNGFFLWDHLVYLDYEVVDPWIALGAIAATTATIRLGPLVTPLPRRRPWRVAHEALTLDRLSGGRAVLGVGIGSDHHGDFSAYDGEPVDERDRGAALDEALEIVTRLWAGAPVTFEGRHFGLRDVRFRARPVQTPRVPIWCAAQWPNRKPLARAARYDGVVPVGCMTPGNVEELRTIVGVGCDVVIPSFVATTADPTAYRDAGATWWLSAFRPDAELDAIRAVIEAGPPR